jgi:2-(1,2-epoxy-1,2-dihydrophenyl)acetyl-CoA isomerase
VYPQSTFDEEVLTLAHKLAAGPVQAYGVAKTLMNQAAGVDRLDYHLDLELEHLARSADGPEFAEGLQAFLARREPQFVRR